jgi:hypothetical protein
MNGGEEKPVLLIVIASVIGAIVVGIAVHPVAALVPLLLGAIAANRVGYRHQGAMSAVPVKQPAAESTTQKLEQLAGLRDRGIITSDDYEAKKAELLA